jgi:hypothetical protein
MSIPVSSVDVAHLLAPYPHVAGCLECREYVDEYLDDHQASTVLAAVLDHHDSAHLNDRLSPRAAYF